MLKLYARPSAAIGPRPRSLRPRPPRDDIECSATLCTGNAFYRVKLCDVSRFGCKIFLPEPVWAGDRVQIALEAYHSLGATIRWQRDGRAGVQFARPLSDAELDRWKAALCVSRTRDTRIRRARRNFWGEWVEGGERR